MSDGELRMVDASRGPLVMPPKQGRPSEKYLESVASMAATASGCRGCSRGALGWMYIVQYSASNGMSRSDERMRRPLALKSTRALSAMHRVEITLCLACG